MYVVLFYDTIDGKCPVQDSDITRVFYFFFIGQKVVLTNGFIKKTNKTPMAEKILAQKYKDDYERRYGNEQLQGL